MHVLLKGIELRADLFDLNRIGRYGERLTDIADVDDRRRRARWDNKLVHYAAPRSDRAGKSFASNEGF